MGSPEITKRLDYKSKCEVEAGQWRQGVRTQRDGICTPSDQLRFHFHGSDRHKRFWLLLLDVAHGCDLVRLVGL
jgi:hypothetical protein